MLKGFREFITRGNVIDMAVGIIIGGAFTPIVTALTENFLMPIISGIVGKPNFDNVLEFHLGSALVQPGVFLTAVVNFLLIAAAVYFAIILPMNSYRARKEAAKAAEPEEKEVSADVALLTEIRDLLARNNN